MKEFACLEEANREITGISYDSIQKVKRGCSTNLWPNHFTGEKIINLWALVTHKPIYEVPRK